MEKKILWTISFALIFILWIKAGPFKSDDLDIERDDTSDLSALEQDSDATSDEKSLTLSKTRTLILLP